MKSQWPLRLTIDGVKPACRHASSTASQREAFRVEHERLAREIRERHGRVILPARFARRDEPQRAHHRQPLEGAGIDRLQQPAQLQFARRQRAASIIRAPCSNSFSSMFG